MSDLDEIYSRAWFEHDFAELQPEFNIAADALADVFALAAGMHRHRAKVLDVGCGPGMIVRRLREHGVDARGLDGSRHALEYAAPEVREHLKLFDIRTGEPSSARVGTFDLVVCTEVAEHIEEEHADSLVALLEGTARTWIVLTAAGPGQDGNHHVNCQPAEYWIRKLEAVDFTHVAGTTARLKEAWAPLQRLSHMTRNVLVFRGSR